jgi:hypothetical protein
MTRLLMFHDSAAPGKDPSDPALLYRTLHRGRRAYIGGIRRGKVDVVDKTAVGFRRDDWHPRGALLYHGRKSCLPSAMLQ